MFIPNLEHHRRVTSYPLTAWGIHGIGLGQLDFPWHVKNMPQNLVKNVISITFATDNASPRLFNELR